VTAAGLERYRALRAVAAMLLAAAFCIDVGVWKVLALNAGHLRKRNLRSRSWTGAAWLSTWINYRLQ
jgi:hypothetical protein